MYICTIILLDKVCFCVIFLFILLIFVLFSEMTEVQHNMNAINAYNRLNANVAGLKKASEKLSSGYRINRAGDDAAGLAVSEKMRSQIKGLNQAIRNSQDGINMIQTFEGAAQETHSILQRMKELATQSANGTYDNATDRAAMELEFKQLNDELDQIADTDFNGTIVLNGGQMSDGMYAINNGALLKADDGSKYITGAEFDYKTGRDMIEAEEEAAAAAAAASKPTDVVAYDKTETVQTADHAEKKIADNNTYGQDEATALWTATGADKIDGLESMNITFQLKNGAWTAVAASDDEGNELKGVDFSKVKADPTTDNGGFTVKDTNVNVIFNTTYSKDGDYVTVNFTNGSPAKYAPTNIGLDEAADVDSKIAGVTVAKGDLADDDMDADVKEALDQLDSVDFEFKYAAGAITIENLADFDKLTLKGEDGNEITAAGITSADGTGTITVEDKAGHKLAEITLDANKWVEDMATATVDGTAGDLTGGNVADGASATFTWSEADGAWKDNANNVVDLTQAVLTNGKFEITVTGTPADGDKITLEYKDPDGGGTALQTANAATKGAGVTVTYEAATPATVTAGVQVDGYEANEGTGAIAHSVATKQTDYLKEKLGITGEKKEDRPLSESDAFENSEARLTYSNNITLQTGARSKDAVRFTFAYNQDNSVDMRGLDANLNLSSRADGLNTANLSLATQDDANHAIDQIDKAINKTSMVRATFGAIQNRLEHKITNLTTTSENLTEAESSIRDTDMASEMMNYTKFNILQQAAQSMLAQANQQPQSILQLLG